ncbi:mitochondrial arginine transporter BAC1-like isoform X1 [Chenopodium quinoa]|uniref:mitochondrial arginine transporter BAC1-like isoform X1 n=1 Tax=Chenopodium quinoa TaxID=63459 RepID=UPI000B786E62|nr:mitochondrial arginine transporter BAC1-like isoform X1 [Chenopodium quinoa]
MVERSASSADVSKYKEYLAGLIAGVATVIIGHPFDTVKVKLQKHNTEVHGVKYRNGLHCAARILQNEGVRGLYRGATSSFIGMGFESSLLFGIYSQTKQSLQGKLQSSGPDSLVIIPSAAYSGAIISFVLCPTELVKCRMQIQGTDSLIPKGSTYTGPVDCALKTIRTDGVTGIFRGGMATFLRESVGNAVFFSVYENVRHSMHLKLKDCSGEYKGLAEIGVGIISGGLGGVAFWSAVLPLDMAKTMIQTNPDPNYSRNPFQVLKLVYKQAGLRGCYAGLGPTIARAFPANAAAIVTWEFAMKILGIRHE